LFISTSGEEGTVVSNVEIRYDWQTSGQFDSDDFTTRPLKPIHHTSTPASRAYRLTLRRIQASSSR
jgi:hypothetical protein